MAAVDQDTWTKLLATVAEVSVKFSEGVTVIGGVAVYAHAMDADLPAVEFSHDGDMMMALADFADLRDIEEVTPNRRRSKHQFTKNGFEFDVYVEDQHGLLVPYADAMAHSEVHQGIRVTCLEHLLTLKCVAAEDRKASAKGAKDRRDIARILLTMAKTGCRPDRLCYLQDSHLDMIKDVASSSVFLDLAHRNAHVARGWQSQAKSVCDAIATSFSCLPAP